MKYRYLLLLSLILPLLTGCVSVYKRENFHVSNHISTIQESASYSTRLGIGSNTKISHIPFIYWYAKDSQPYYLYFMIRFDEIVAQPLLIHSVNLTSENTVILSKTYNDPESINFIKKYDNSDACEAGYTLPLGDRLQFKDGRTIELEVTWEILGVEKKQTMKVLVIGEKSKNTTSLFTHYMSI